MKSSLEHFYDRQITPIQSQYAEIVIYHVCLIYEANKVSRCLLRYAGYVRVLRVTICVSNCFFVDPRIFSPLPNLLSSIRLYTFKACHFLWVLMRDAVCATMRVVHECTCYLIRTLLRTIIHEVSTWHLLVCLCMRRHKKSRSDIFLIY